MRWKFAVVFGCLALAAGATAPPAPREGIGYDLSIAGIPIGSARLDARLDAGRYSIRGTADVGFLFWGGTGGALAEGQAADGRLRPAQYRLDYEGVSRPGGARIDFAGDRAVMWENFPPPPEEFREGRVAVTDAHLRGVLDPLSALVIPAPADAPPETVCRRLLPVFSGFTRFDLELTGPAPAPTGIGCTARYRPVAGHRPDSRSVARMTEPGAFEIALAPIASNLWGPARVAVQTRFGLFEMVRAD